jgi:2-keto-4-pentenoate hydratase/2-oxohepta-3-ene-1,7-dioic acid hydratase in catechol pathway
MRVTRAAVILALTVGLSGLAWPAEAEVTTYVRYTYQGTTSYGVLEGEQIRELDKAPFEGGHPTGVTVARSAVELLAPTEPSKVIAVGFNYRSHRGDREFPADPPIFLKLPTTIVGPEAEIVFPEGASNVHFEGELVVVIGKTARRISPDEAAGYIFGVTAGNDVSERDWQAADLQWFRAKGSDTFGPLGPVLVRGLDYNDLLLQTRLNGTIMQSERTSDLIHDVHEIVSFVSRFVTLYPGDVIYTGTPGDTSAMKPGDVVEIELEGVGVLRNRIAR